MPIYWRQLEGRANDAHDLKYRKNIKPVKVEVSRTDNTGYVISLVPLFQDQLLKTLPHTSVDGST